MSDDDTSHMVRIHPDVLVREIREQLARREALDAENARLRAVEQAARHLVEAIRHRRGDEPVLFFVDDGRPTPYGQLLVALEAALGWRR